MSVFRFKHFEVVNEQSSMKVNTDGVLLGAAVSLSPSDLNVLDAGTGTGTIALMLAQRLAGMGLAPAILGIDIDGPSAAEAASNFAASPWPQSLEAMHIPLREYVPGKPLDLIVSNPPYFDNSLQAPDGRRNVARHTEVGQSLSYRDISAYAAEYLTPDGRLALILPSDQEHALLRCLRSYELHPYRILRIRSTSRKQPSRIVVESSRCRSVVAETMLTIQDGGAYTPEYLALMREFYLFA